MSKADWNNHITHNRIEGFFGGKFLPMHKGHLYCIDTAAKQCDHVVVIMFINGDDELRVRSADNDSTLQIDYRIEQGRRVCSLYPKVDFAQPTSGIEWALIDPKTGLLALSKTKNAYLELF